MAQFIKIAGECQDKRLSPFYSRCQENVILRQPDPDGGGRVIIYAPAGQLRLWLTGISAFILAGIRAEF